MAVGDCRSRLGDQHFDMKVWCPICWELFTSSNTLQRHLPRKHPDHSLARRRDEIKLTTCFYLAHDPLRWNPSIGLDKNQGIINIIKRLYAESSEHVFPDKILMKCPRNVQEAKTRGLVKSVEHEKRGEDSPPDRGAQEAPGTTTKVTTHRSKKNSKRTKSPCKMESGSLDKKRKLESYS